MARNARYDEIANWYPAWVGDGEGLIAEGVGDLLPATVRGARVLRLVQISGRRSRRVLDRTADLLLVQSGPGVYTDLVGDRGWTADAYQTWLAETIETLLRP